MIKFGTGGWRAVIGDDFTKANIQLLAQGVGQQNEERGCDRTGHGSWDSDRRFLSKEAMQWAAEVFAAAQIKAYLIKQILTDTACHVLRDEARFPVRNDDYRKP